MNWEAVKQYLEDDIQCRLAGLTANQEVLRGLNSNPPTNENNKSKVTWSIRPPAILLLGVVLGLGLAVTREHLSVSARAVQFQNASLMNSLLVVGEPLRVSFALYVDDKCHGTVARFFIQDHKTLVTYQKEFVKVNRDPNFPEVVEIPVPEQLQPGEYYFRSNAHLDCPDGHYDMFVAPMKFTIVGDPWY